MDKNNTQLEIIKELHFHATIISLTWAAYCDALAVLKKALKEQKSEAEIAEARLLVNTTFEIALDTERQCFDETMRIAAATKTPDSAH